MKIPPYRNLAIALGLPLALLSPGRAQTANQLVKLPQFTVSGEASDPYHPADTMSVARIRGQLIDTPLSINVVTSQLLDDLGANSSWDATKYFAGVSSGRGAGTAGGINDRQDFRGFESQTRTVDSFSSTFLPGTSTSIDTFEPDFIERVEVVLGPDAILNPTGTPGGSINVISKSPLFVPRNSIYGEVGNDSAQKLALDLTGPLPIAGSKHLAYRVIVTDQDTRTYIPGRWTKSDLAAELTYQFNPADSLTFKYFGVDYAAYGNASAPNDNGWLIYDPRTIGGVTISGLPTTTGVTYNGTNGVDTNSKTTEFTNTAQLVYTGSLFDVVSMRLGGQFLEHNNVGDSAYPSLSTTETFDPVTGQVTGVPSGFNPASIPEVWRYNKSLQLNSQVENDYAADFHPGPVSLQPVAGWSIQDTNSPLSRTGTGAMPNADLLTGDYSAPRPDIHTFKFSGRGRSEASAKEAYALLKAGFLNDHLYLLSGVTRIWVANQSYTFDPNSLALTSYNALSGFRDCYLGSVLIKPVDHVSVYYTYSTNANLTSFNPGNGIAIPLWSQGRQHEFGLKSEFLDQRLSFTVDHFQIAQTNVTSPNPLANIDPTAAGNILTDNTNRGFEANLTGGLTKNLSVIASYTNMHYRDAFGRRVRNVPDSMANLLLNYHFTDGALKNLSVFGALEQNGQVAGETTTGFTSLGATKQVGFYIASYHVFNAGASYKIGRYGFNLNVDNVANSKFAWEPASRLSVSPYPGVTFRLSTRISF